MKLEQQVVSLELAKRLKELGVKQESYFDWQVPKSRTIPEGQLLRVENFDSEFFDYFSAFTVAELGEMLPLYTKTWYCLSSSDTNNWIGKIGQLPEANYKIFPFNGRSVEIGREITYFYANSEAGARAKMLIYLLENKLINQ
jgi:hypothetical protein